MEFQSWDRGVLLEGRTEDLHGDPMAAVCRRSGEADWVVNLSHLEIAMALGAKTTDLGLLFRQIQA